MNRIWNKRSIEPVDASDAGFACFYGSLIAPFAVDAWLMLMELKQLGFCPTIDERDHVKDGIKHASLFLVTAKNVDPDFRVLLEQGIYHLSKMESLDQEPIVHSGSLLEKAQDISARLIVSFYRNIGSHNNCPPTAKTSDEKIIEIYYREREILYTEA